MERGNNLEQSNFFNENIMGLLTILGILVALVGVYYTRKSTKKEVDTPMSRININDNAQVDSIKIDKSRSNFYGETKLVKDNKITINNNNESNKVTKEVVIMRVNMYLNQLKDFEEDNLTISELKPINYSDDEVIIALSGVDDNVVMQTIKFINETKTLSELLKDRKEFFIARGLRENMPVMHFELNKIDRNIERVFNSLRDKTTFKIIEKLKI